MITLDLVTPLPSCEDRRTATGVDDLIDAR
jgi:hypothetical protein